MAATPILAYDCNSNFKLLVQHRFYCSFFSFLFLLFTAVLSKWDISYRKFGLPFQGKASCDRVAPTYRTCRVSLYWNLTLGEKSLAVPGKWTCIGSTNWATYPIPPFTTVTAATALPSYDCNTSIKIRLQCMLGYNCNTNIRLQLRHKY